MSGGGSGGGSGGPGITVDEVLPCDRLQFEAHLQSPDFQVVSQLNAGDQLDVVVEGQAVAALSAHGRAGWIVERLPNLLRCIQAGHIFRAEVLSTNGGAVNVKVYRP